jgi:hypothetical protein
MPAFGRDLRHLASYRLTRKSSLMCSQSKDTGTVVRDFMKRLICVFVFGFCVAYLITFIACGQDPIGAPASRGTLQVFDNSTAKGTWISSGYSHVGLFIDKKRNMPVIALESKAGQGPGHEFAVSLYQGKPTLQVCKGDEVVILDLFDAAKALEKLMAEDGRDPRTVGSVGAAGSESPAIVNQAPVE